MPSGWIGRENLRSTARFLDQYPARGRLPGDVLSELLDEDRGRALAWAASEI
jgi:hypothetical protein